MTEEIEFTVSPLCQRLESEGKSVQVDIYSDGAGAWLLEVVDEFGNSTCWEDPFPTDQEALDEARNTIRDEGVAFDLGAMLGILAFGAGHAFAISGLACR